MGWTPPHLWSYQIKVYAGKRKGGRVIVASHEVAKVLELIEAINLPDANLEQIKRGLIVLVRKAGAGGYPNQCGVIFNARTGGKFGCNPTPFNLR